MLPKTCAFWCSLVISSSGKLMQLILELFDWCYDQGKTHKYMVSVFLSQVLFEVQITWIMFLDHRYHSQNCFIHDPSLCACKMVECFLGMFSTRVWKWWPRTAHISTEMDPYLLNTEKSSASCLSISGSLIEMLRKSRTLFTSLTLFNFMSSYLDASTVGS